MMIASTETAAVPIIITNAPSEPPLFLYCIRAYSGISIRRGRWRGRSRMRSLKEISFVRRFRPGSSTRRRRVEPNEAGQKYDRADRSNGAETINWTHAKPGCPITLRAPAPMLAINISPVGTFSYDYDTFSSQARPHRPCHRLGWLGWGACCFSGSCPRQFDSARTSRWCARHLSRWA